MWEHSIFLRRFRPKVRTLVRPALIGGHWWNRKQCYISSLASTGHFSQHLLGMSDDATGWSIMYRQFVLFGAWETSTERAHHGVKCVVSFTGIISSRLASTQPQLAVLIKSPVCLYVCLSVCQWRSKRKGRLRTRAYSDSRLPTDGDRHTKVEKNPNLDPNPYHGRGEVTAGRASWKIYVPYRIVSAILYTPPIFLTKGQGFPLCLYHGSRPSSPVKIE